MYVQKLKYGKIYPVQLQEKFDRLVVGCPNILLSHKKNEKLPFVTTCMDLEGIMLSKIREMEKDKCI